MWAAGHLATRRRRNMRPDKWTHLSLLSAATHRLAWTKRQLDGGNVDSFVWSMKSAATLIIERRGMMKPHTDKDNKRCFVFLNRAPITSGEPKNLNTTDWKSVDSFCLIECINICNAKTAKTLQSGSRRIYIYSHAGLFFFFTEWAIYPGDCLFQRLNTWQRGTLLMTKSLFDGHRLNTVYVPHHVWSKMLNIESSLRNVLYFSSFWNSAVFSTLRVLVACKENFLKCSKKSFFDPLCLDFEHSRKVSNRQNHLFFQHDVLESIQMWARRRVKWFQMSNSAFVQAFFF